MERCREMVYGEMRRGRSMWVNGRTIRPMGMGFT